MTLTDYVVQKASRAKAAARQLATLSTAVKNKALLAMADALEAREAELLEANKKDLAGARGLSKAAIDRLTLNAKRIKEMAVGLREARHPGRRDHVHRQPRPPGLRPAAQAGQAD